MAGFRTFATGEVLTAANVNNFLMKQSVMVFDDATARTAALGADVVEGMLTYNLATDQLEVFDGTNFVVAAPEPPAGIGSNVVQAVLTDTFSASVAEGALSPDVTGLDAVITPSSATSKVLVIAVLSLSCADVNQGTVFSVFRDGTAVFVGDADGARSRRSAGTGSGSRSGENASVTFLDAPGSTSAVTYTVRVGHTQGGGDTVSVNRSTSFDLNAIRTGRTASSVTAIEVAA